MNAVNSLLRGLFDLLLSPFQTLSIWWTLTPISLVVGIAALIVWKRFSNQAGIEAAKNDIAASFFEIRLFNDDLRALLRAQGRLLATNGRYLALNLVPMLVMTPPVLMMIVQLQFHYGYQGLVPGSPTTLVVTLDGNEISAQQQPGFALNPPEGVSVESGPVWIPSKPELAWRIAVQAPGRYELEVSVDGITASKSLVASDDIVRRSPIRFAGGLLNQFLFPAESPIGDGPIQSIEVVYPERNVDLGFMELHWTIVLLILSIIFALLLRKRFGVTF